MFTQWVASFSNSYDIGWELVGRWNEPHRHYHGLTHLRHSLKALDQLANPGEQTTIAELALWFHDAIYEGKAGADEEASASLAVELLGKYATGKDVWITPDEVQEVARLVRLTMNHDPAQGDRLGQLVCDADLAILGAESIAYDAYAKAIRQEFAHFSDEEFRTGRTLVLDSLIAKTPLYRTERGKQLWQEAAAQNLSVEQRGLQQPTL